VVVDRAVEGDVQHDARTGWDGDTAARDVTAGGQFMPGARSEAQPPAEAAQTVVVGDLPAQAAGFLPRAALLAELDRADSGVTVIHPAAGWRGAGATQLAAAYARARLQAGWRLVGWISGADLGSLQAGLASMADAIGLTGRDAGHGGAAAAAVRNWLETYGDRCLLVFDGVSDPAELDGLIPARGPARILITGPLGSPAGLGSAVAVDAFSTAEASGFLAERTGLDEPAGAAAVAAVLGHLPLPLAVAAPVIGSLHTGYAGYLDRLQATSVRVSLTGDDGQPYPDGFARAVLLSLRAVRAEDRTGVCARVLELMSVLSAAGVRRDLLYAAGRAGVLADGRQRVAASPVDRVLTWLGERALLTFSVDGQTVMVHSLVAQVIRADLDRRGELTARCEAAAFVLDVYSRALVGSADRSAARGVPQQVTALLGALAGAVTEVDEELAWLLLRLRFTAFYHLLELGDSTLHAIAIGEPLAEDLERLLGADHPDTLNSRNSLATAYLSAGRVAEAIDSFEQTLDVRRRILGPDDPDTLTLQNNLASAYQDAGRLEEAIQLYALNLQTRERLLGGDHPSTLNSRGNLAAAYRAAGRADEAIPLLERTLAGREQALGPDHPDTQTSRRNLAQAYQDAGRGDEAVPLLDQTSAARKPIWWPDDPAAAQNFPARPAPASRPAGRPDATRPAPVAAPPAAPAAFRRPPAEPARRVLPAGLRRPPLDAARPPLPASLAHPPPSPARSPRHRDGQGSPGPPGRPADVLPDEEIAGALGGADQDALAMAYDRYAASLYGYCHWMLQDPAAAAEALTDTFVVAAARASDLPEPGRLRAWLFALARGECRRRIRPGSASPGDPANPADPADLPGQPSEADTGPSDSTVQFSAINVAGPSWPAEVAARPADATVQFPALGQRADEGGTVSDSTVQFRAAGRPAGLVREPFETMPLGVAGLPTDATMTFMVVSPAVPRAADLSGDRAEAELRSLLHSVQAGLSPREREAIELSFRHDLDVDELAIVFGVSWSRARALADRASARLEEALGALHIALTRRDSCAELGELLADWDGQLTEQTRELVSWHIRSCPTCAQHGWGALRPAAFGRLLPPAPLPVELRARVLDRGTSPAADAVAYRRRAARRAGALWRAGMARAIRQLSWAGIRAHGGTAIAAAAVALWAAAAVIVLLLTFAGHHSVSAPVAQASTVPPAGARPARARTAASPGIQPHSPDAGSVTPSHPVAPVPAVSSLPVSQATASQPSPSPDVAPSSSAATGSASPKPSRSPSPSQPASSSPAPSRSASPSASSSSSSSASPSP
jgi:RNA polymerase sigma factor (sigma-70 family)